jgi:signal transduction histidine kinase
LKSEHHNLSRSYRVALGKFLSRDASSSLEVARGFGSRALAAGLLTLDLARLHEHTLVCDILPKVSPRKRAGVIRKAGTFFAVAITPIEKTQRSAQVASAQLKRFIETLSRRTVELAASNLELNLEITQRLAAEKELENSKLHSLKLLHESNRMQQQMRHLSRQIISAHEDERKKISRELHDVIAQVLTGINVRLAVLKKDAASNSKGLAGNIDRTQRLVEKSVDLVHQFARELRPAVLDDLGLIPAMHSYLKVFTARTGVRSKLIAFPGVEQIDSNRKTVLFRVAQEALVNVSRHARATNVEVRFRKLTGGVGLRIRDDGKSFDVRKVFSADNRRRLGLLGMRERVEMVGGTFSIASAPATGTIVDVQIPLSNTPGVAAVSANKLVQNTDL